MCEKEGYAPGYAPSTLLHSLANAARQGSRPQEATGAATTKIKKNKEKHPQVRQNH